MDYFMLYPVSLEPVVLATPPTYLFPFKTVALTVPMPPRPVIYVPLSPLALPLYPLPLYRESLTPPLHQLPHFGPPDTGPKLDDLPKSTLLSVKWGDLHLFGWAPPEFFTPSPISLLITSLLSLEHHPLRTLWRRPSISSLLTTHC